MFTYSQSSGEFRHDGTSLCFGYSGFADGKNNPDKEAEHDIGPIPKGTYRIGSSYISPQFGPVVMSLTPFPENQMFGRAGFLIHGDSTLHPGYASHGCIILPRNIRQLIARSGDDVLMVTG